MNNLEIKKIREELGLTQQGLADLLQSNIRTVQKWESGESKIRTSTAYMLNELRHKGVDSNNTNNSEIENKIQNLNTLKEVGDFVADHFDEVREASTFFNLIMKQKKRD